MKKLAAITSGIGYLFTVATAFADTTQIKINEPRGPGGEKLGYSDISDFISKAIQLAFIIAIVAVLVMLVWGAIEWIFSGGNKEAVGNAQKRIVNALIGLGVLALALALTKVAATFLGFPDITLVGFPIPHPE